jgi:hypothetical protein
MKFGTVINGMDGRVQYPVLDYLKNQFEIDFFDTANEVDPLTILSDRTDKCRLISLKEKITFSIEEHHSRLVAVVGHHDFSGNSNSREKQETQLSDTIDYLRRAYGDDIMFIGHYVTEEYKVEEIMRSGG